MLTIKTVWNNVHHGLVSRPNENHTKIPTPGVKLIIKEREDLVLQINKLENEIRSLKGRLEEAVNGCDARDDQISAQEDQIAELKERLKAFAS